MGALGKSARRVALPVTAFVLMSAASHAQPTPYLVKDINTLPQGVCDISNIAGAGSRAYFFADDCIHGIQLWVTDGTAEGTRAIGDFPLPAMGMIREATAVGSSLFFVVYEQNVGYVLWRSDGTPEGTSAVYTMDYAGGASTLSTLTAWNERLLFVGHDPEHGDELWLSDGTEDGTGIFVDISVGPVSGVSRYDPEILVSNDRLWFAADDGVHGRELWSSDGSVANTALVVDLVPGPQGSDPWEITSAGERVLFSAFVPAYGREPWSSDGTPDGTRLVVDALPGLDWSSPISLTPVGDTLYFLGLTGDEEDPRGLWATSGGQASLLLSNPFCCWEEKLTALDEVVLFAAEDPDLGYELWLSDGSPMGTHVVADIAPGGAASSPQHLTRFGESVYFAADDGFVGVELWKTDGTWGGTHIVRDLAPGTTSSRPGDIVAQSFGLLFQAGVDASESRELIVSDGSTEGTGKLIDLNPGTAPADVARIVLAGSAVFFVANDVFSGYELWTSDGTMSGTNRVLDINPGAASGVSSAWAFPSLAVNGQEVFFRANDGLSGDELWKTDGTAGGTSLVADIVPGAEGADVRWITSLDGVVYFRATNDDYGAELWKSDGTMHGTEIVRDIIPGPTGSFPDQFFVFNSQLFFIAQGGLWVSAGDSESTSLVIPGSLADISEQLIVLDDFFLASAEFDESAGYELWRSDGTQEGTTLVKDIYSGSASSEPRGFTRFGDGVVFSAYEPSTGHELWYSDGTPQGTRLLKNIEPFGGDSWPHGFLVFGEYVYFSAFQSGIGLALWRTDGTAAGTTFVRDFSPKDFDYGEVIPLGVVGDLLYLNAQSATSLQGALWVADGTSDGFFEVGPIYAIGNEYGPTFLQLPGARVVFSANGELYALDLCAAPSSCADANECTSDECFGGACGWAERTGSCGDDTFCNGEDVCVSGECTHISDNPCDVGDACDEQTDSCIPPSTESTTTTVTTTTTPPQPSCGDPNGDGEVTATDALISLTAAVGIEQCGLAVCDANGDGKVTASDALVLLKVAVGEPIELNCPA